MILALFIKSIIVQDELCERYLTLAINGYNNYTFITKVGDENALPFKEKDSTSWAHPIRRISRLLQRKMWSMVRNIQMLFIK
jgi:hypothetical protein